MSTTTHPQWTTRFAFILAAAGSAVGLGNIWKFPYITGEYGGGAFVLVYLACIALIGVPVMMAEILLGRQGRQSPIHTMRNLAQAQHASSGWQIIGWMGVVAGFLILSFYSVVAGWAFAYIPEAISGNLNGLDKTTSGALFGELTGSPTTLLFWHTLFMLLTALVVSLGVQNGLERLVKILMPALVGLLILLVGYAMASGKFLQGLDYLFNVNFSAVFYTCQGASCTFTAEPLLVALGHAFFTLSLGMGAIMVYGSYMPGKAFIASSTLMVAIADTVIALLAGMAIFPLVFANDLTPGAGPGLVFVTLPIAFGSMPAGQFFGSLFFVLLLIAAWSSAISLVEPAVAWLTERWQWCRVRATLAVTGLAWILGIGSVLSFNYWSGPEYQWFGKTFFDLKDYLASNILLPLGGLLIALFTAWAAQRRFSEQGLALSRGFALWWWLIRYLAPLGIALIFLHAIGLV
ncbi:MAG: sodium-dependent transporter [Pseudomonadota bacterium]